MDFYVFSFILQLSTINKLYYLRIYVHNYS